MKTHTETAAGLTPRTDAEEYEQPWTGIGPDGVKVVSATFARQLERENAELRAALTETADQLEDLIEATEGLAGLDDFQKDALANSRVVLRAVARAALNSRP